MCPEREPSMLLSGKVAVIYGDGGNVGGATARVFAREGARVILAGRTALTLDSVAADIRMRGGQIETAVVDALVVLHDRGELTLPAAPAPALR